jgi:hypothetical protein
MFGDMRSLAPVCVVLLLCACQTEKALHAERRVVTPVFAGPRITVTCELHYYVLGELREPSSLPLLARHGGDLDPVDRPVGLLREPERDLAWAVKGFVLRIVQPARYAGQFLTAHRDGDTFDPFKACAPGKRYVVDVPPKLINDARYRLCW